MHYDYDVVILAPAFEFLKRSAALVEFNAETQVVPTTTLGVVTIQFNEVAKTIQCQLQVDSME